MIKEDYVKFNMAQELESLGFPQKGDEKYCDHDGYRYKKDGTITQPIYTGEWVNLNCPSLSIVQKWLREEKQTMISMIYSEFTDKTWTALITCYPKKKEVYVQNKDTCCFEIYEEALEKAIGKAIEILKA